MCQLISKILFKLLRERVFFANFSSEKYIEYLFKFDNILFWISWRENICAILQQYWIFTSYLFYIYTFRIIDNLKPDKILTSKYFWLTQYHNLINYDIYHWIVFYKAFWGIQDIFLKPQFLFITIKIINS